MKKICSMILIVVLMLSLSLTVSAHEKVTTAVYGFPEAIDGVRDDGWKYAESIEIDDYVADGAYKDIGKERSSAVVWSMWDEDYLYFFAEVTDITPDGKVKDALWDQDALGFMINYDYSTVNTEQGKSYRGLGEKGYAGYTNVAPTFDSPETHSREADTVFDLDRYYNEIESYVVETDDGWAVEIQIPLSVYDDFEEGDKIGYEICLNMGSGGNTRVGQAVWKFADNARGQNSWTDPATFGTLILGAAPVVEEAGATETAPSTFDALTAAAVISALSLAGFTVCKKRGNK